MASTEDVIQLQFAVLGQADVKAAQKEIGNLKKEMVALQQSYADGKVTEQQRADGMASMAAQIKRANETIQEANKHIPKLTSGIAGVGQAGLQAGRAIQDLAQGGIGGILNNIEGLVMAFGGGPGLAGALTAFGIAAYTAKPFIAELFKSLTSDEPVKKVTDDIGELEKEITELQAKPVRLTFEDIELEDKIRKVAVLKKAVDEFNAATSSRTQREKLVGGTVSEHLAAMDEPTIARSLSALIGDEMLRNDEQLKKLNEERTKARHDAAAHAAAQESGVRGAGAWRAEAIKKIVDTKEAIERRRYEIQKTGGDSDRAAGVLLCDLKAGKALDVPRALERLEQLGFGDEVHTLRTAIENETGPDLFERNEDANQRYAAAKKKREAQLKAIDRERKAFDAQEAQIWRLAGEAQKRAAHEAEQVQRKKEHDEEQAREHSVARVRRLASRYDDTLGLQARAMLGGGAPIGHVGQYLTQNLQGAIDERGERLDALTIGNVVRSLIGQAQEQNAAATAGFAAQLGGGYLAFGRAAMLNQQQLAGELRKQQHQLNELMMQASDIRRQLPPPAARPLTNRGG
jgi:hypothetical protein